jgi:hypothetical protein
MEHNIAALKKQLSAVGFEDGLEYALRCRMCFHFPQFTIPKRVVFGKDVLNLMFHFVWTGEQNEYCCSCYDAVLRKEIQIPDLLIGNIKTSELDHQMTLIDWRIGLDHENGSIGDKSDNGWGREKAISEVVMALATLASHGDEGKDIADRLKMKHWADGPPEILIEGLASLKSRFEISQRFYLFTAAECITTTEAYRFLSNRWMEKKMQVRKKLSVEASGKGSVVIPSKKKGRK